MFTLSFIPGVNTLYCLEEQRISLPGDNFTPGTKFTPGDNSPPESKFAPRGEVKNGPLVSKLNDF
jgi:hypothetical protein